MPYILIQVNENITKFFTLIDALPTLWGIQMWVPNWKQQKNKELGHAP
jgi:hypothetical protein